jgi:oligopeptide/dipeptide ABC transporter ATP-binding protein
MSETDDPREPESTEPPTEVSAAGAGEEAPTEVQPGAGEEALTEVQPGAAQPDASQPDAEQPATEVQPATEAPAASNGDGSILLDVDHLQVLFPIKSGVIIDRQVGQVHAVDDVSFDLHSGETLGVVGESGCGKTTLIRALVRLIEPTSGTVSFDGEEITKLSRRQMEPIRRQMQMVFQDPQASLNPRKRVGQILAVPLQIRGISRGDVQQEARALLDRVGLAQDVLNRFPHEFSGGQRQRIGIARALAVNPKLVLLDEPVSALDVSIQAQVINLLDELQDELQLSYVFVAHDLSVVRHVSDRIVVMYLGKLMEISPAEELYRKPIHPYTSALLGAIPIPDPNENRVRERAVIEGEPPNPINPPTGCRFHTRCPRASEICRTSEPPLTEYAGGHLAACHHPQNITQAEIDASRRSDQSSASSGSETPDLSPGTGLQSTLVSAPASA